MTPEELLLIDLCARLPYGVKVKCGSEILTFNVNWLQMFQHHLDEIKSYLRPMSSMTKEEVIEYLSACDKDYKDSLTTPRHSGVDWLNANHFDYRGLIEKGLALEAKEGMYKTE